MNKLRVGIYKKAIKFLERELTWTSKRKTYHASGCCRYIQLAAGVEGHEGLIELPEYKLFKRMFGSGAGQDTYWFGEPNREKDGMPHKVNENSIGVLRGNHEEGKT
jgi:hypothetical protein